MREERETCGVPSGIRLMNLLRERLTEIMDRERANRNSIHLYCTGPYWVAFERSAYQLHRAFSDSETTPLRLFAYPFPIVMGLFQRNVKRIGDCALAFLALIVFSPLFLLCYIAVKREDGGPAIFRQERIGRFGRPFNIYKFRSMRLDAEKFGPALYKGGADPRITRVGKFLRVHHLDELPQLWNVFVGDMSFIGPRPERKFYIDQIMERDPRYRYLYQIRPGVTSYATLYNGYTDTVDKMLRRLRYDLFYLEHRSWLFDFKILVKTFLNIAFGKKF